MKAHPSQQPPEWDDLAGLLAHPGERELPPGRHELHRARLMAAIEQTGVRRTAPAAPRMSWRRPVLALAGVAVTAAVATGVVTAVGGGSGPTVAGPSPVASGPTAEPTMPDPTRPGLGVPAKLRGYGTVQQLTDTADLVVRGTVVQVTGAGADRRAVYRTAEVLYAAPGISAGTEITITGPAIDGMSPLEVGQETVVYLAVADPQARLYSTLSGDFGIFDLAGDTATTRSLAMSVSGLRAEDATARDRKFATTVQNLRLLARERAER